MAATLVQSTKVYFSSPAGTNVASFTNPVGNGSLLVLSVGSTGGDNTITSIIDSLGQTWTIAGTPAEDIGDNATFIFYVLATVAGTCQVTITLPSSGTGMTAMAVILAEYTGSGTSPSALTITNKATGVNTTTPSCGAIAATPGNLVVAAFTQNHSQASVTVADPLTLRQAILNNATLGPGYADDLAAPGTVTPTFTLVTTFSDWACVGASFVVIAPVTPPPPPPTPPPAPTPQPTPPPQPAPQTSQSERAVTLVAVSGGNVFVAPASGSTWTAAINNTGKTLIASGVVRSAANNQKLWFADGSNWLYYDPSVNTVFDWTASQGQLPVDGAGNTPRLICTWRGRTVLSGLLLDGQNWFMSATGDPTNWDYTPFPVLVTQAVAGNNSPLGLIGDVVTALIPYNDDIMIFGSNSQLWMLNGDPNDGGQLDRLSDIIGVCWGQAWCRDPFGVLYFVSNQTGIYSLTPGQGPPIRISQQIEQLLVNINTGLNNIRLIWDDRWQGFHVFITLIANIAPCVHFFWELRTGAWWTDTFANQAHNPLCCVIFDGNTPQDRRALLESWDGYVRALSKDALNDDGTAINTAVVLGPLLANTLDDILLKYLQPVLGETSGAVTYAVYVGTSAEGALQNAPVATGTWGAGRNANTMIRRSGHAVWVKLTSQNAWAIEQIRASFYGQGRVRQRGKY